MTDPDHRNPLDDDLIDRIVDGNLGPAELRATIVLLDREPDGWKRCALAFLEAQCWRESFQSLELPAAHRVEVSPATVLLNAPRARRSRPIFRRIAMAAGIAAVSFATGWLVHPDRPSAIVTDGAAPTPPMIAKQQDAPRPSRENPEGIEDPSSEGEFASQPREGRHRPGPGEAAVSVARMRVASLRGSTEVPILTGPNFDEQWLRNQPPCLTEHQKAVLERQGYQVDQHRRIITATLSDGRRVSVPIDQVKLSYSGNDPL
jgi:hypothetical protein